MSPRITLAVLAAVPAAVLLAACSSSPTSVPATQLPRATVAVQATSAVPAVSAAPSTAAPSTAAPASAALDGTWTGQYSGAFQGSFTLTWTQSGSKLTGTIKISAPPSTLSINGSVQGDSISFGTVGSSRITYSGTVSGGSMSGSYQVAGGAGGGPWSASKTG